MKKFILNISFFFLFIVSIHLVLATFADGTTDAFYLRFTSQKQSSLIIGTSRAAQGIVPHNIDSVFNSNDKIYNYAFSINNSPFGRAYFNAIKEKLDNSTTNGLFLISVDPWSILEEKNTEITDIDRNSIFNKMHFFNLGPNIEYLYRNYRKGWGRIILDKIIFKVLKNNAEKVKNINGSWAFLHNDGWLEVSTNMNRKYVQKNTKKKVSSYLKMMENKVFSDYRFDYLVKIINYLNQYGKVYLVRLPVDLSLLEIEENNFPNFDQHMNQLENVTYINLKSTSHLYNYTDGNHLYKKSAKKISSNIANQILQIHN